VDNAATVLADSIIGRSIDLTKYSNDIMRRRILPTLFQLREDLAEQISKLDLAPSLTDSDKSRRLKELMKAADETISEAYKKLGAGFGDDLAPVAEVEAAAAAKDVNRLLQVDLISPGLSQATLDSILKKGVVQGVPAQEYWSRQAQGLMNAYMDQVRQGMLQSQTTGDIVRRVRGTSTGRYLVKELKSGVKRRMYEFRGGVMDLTTRQATALVRTSVQSVANDSRLAMYKGNGDLIKGVQIIVTLDGRTSDICISRSGMSWDLDGNPLEGTKIPFPGAPPWHFNCRSTLVPIVKSWADLSSGSAVSKSKLQKLEDALPESTQSSMDGQVAGELTYEQWLKSKPEEFQIEVLGRGKHSLWLQGKITLAQLVDQNGDSLTLAELKSKYLS
jgi:SPP1 gp7 family putative phage head morphogenesis protein